RAALRERRAAARHRRRVVDDPRAGRHDARAQRRRPERHRLQRHARVSPRIPRDAHRRGAQVRNGRAIRRHRERRRVHARPDGEATRRLLRQRGDVLDRTLRVPIHRRSRASRHARPHPPADRGRTGRRQFPGPRVLDRHRRPARLRARAGGRRTHGRRVVSWTGRSVLVTGAAGFIGSHLTERLVALGARTRAFVHYNALGTVGWLEDSDVRRDIEIVAGDLLDRDGLRRACEGVDVVFHLAALIAIPYSYRAPASYVRTNVEGTLNVLQAA